ncbi:MAG TPA: TonB-dependent receptor [Sphingobium sp.]|uniref:TonB-dependent receptor n=1 Tax=Sphingobium sp. TaxID=1912891 RepID=UPI002ED018EF
MSDRRIIIASAAVVALGCAGNMPSAHAQDNIVQSGDIIVTARKRTERLLDVPVAVSTLSQEQLQRYSNVTLTSISQQVPQLIIAESQNQVGGSINLRGIGAGISNPSTETAVTLNIDGIPISYGNAIRLGQIDLSRVEVLKGPQALFYGKNSPGGIVSLVSQDPGQKFEAKLRTGYEFYAKQRYVEGSVSAPLTDEIGARLVGYYSKEDGWFRNAAYPVAGVTPGPAADSLNAEDVFVRGTITYNPAGGGTRVKAKVAYGQRTRDGIGPTAASQIVFCPGGVSRLSGPIDCALNRYFYSVIIPSRMTALDPSFGNGVPYVRSTQFLGSLSVDQNIGDTLTLSSVTGYYRLTEQSVDPFTFANTAYFAASNNLAASGVSEELRLASNFDGPLNFLVGGFYQDAHFKIAQAFGVDFGAPFLVGSTYYDVHTSATSVFGQARYKLLDNLELAAGGRYSWESKSLYGTSYGSPIDVLSPRKNYHDFSPEVTLTYKPGNDLTLYAAYREGFTSGGFNTVPTTLRSAANQTLPRVDLSYGQMKARGGEAGIKGYLGGRQILFDLVGYYFKYTGLQLSRYDNASFTQLTQNAGGAEIRGVEFSVTVRPDYFPGFSLTGAVAYNHSRYTDFIGGCYAGQSIAAGCNLNPQNPALPASTYGTAANPYQNQDQTGQRLFRAPDIALTAGVAYDHAFSERLGGTMSFDAAYSSDYITQTEANPLNRQAPYWQLNGTITLNGGEGKPWEVALIGRNLTNKLYVVAGSVVGATASGTGTANVRQGDVLGNVSPARAVTLQLTLRDSLLRR